MNRIISIAAVALLAPSLASATAVRWYTGSGADASVDAATFLTPESYTGCDGDWCGASLEYDLGGGLMVVANASLESIQQDIVPEDGGLGDPRPSMGDDIGEGYVRLVFSETVLLEDFFSFWDHGLPNGTDSIVSINGVNYASNGDDWVSVDLVGSEFLFARVDDGYADREIGFYLSAINFSQVDVPEPATALLMLLGLGGLAARRRAKA